MPKYFKHIISDIAVRLTHTEMLTISSYHMTLGTVCHGLQHN